MPVQKKVFNTAREVLGNYLSEVMKEKSINLYQLEKLTGKPSQPLKSVLTGDSNYTIDSLLAVVQALDLYFFFAPKEGEHLNPDHMIKKMDENDPHIKPD